MPDEMHDLNWNGYKDATRHDAPRIFIVLGFIALAGVMSGWWFFSGIRAPLGSTQEKAFVVGKGQGLTDIAGKLEEARLIRSSLAFEILAVFSGQARDLKAGTYMLRSGMPAAELVDVLVRGADQEIDVLIPEGSTIYEIDELLSEAGVIKAGDLVKYALASSAPIEGHLFPDSYRFYPAMPVDKVVARILRNFEDKAGPILAAARRDPLLASVRQTRNGDPTLVLASILEKEVPDDADRRIVAGVLLKRVAVNMPLQVDSSICYIKEMAAGKDVPCLPITALDLKKESPYNTYLQRGWPPGPIGNPGLGAIQAALSPRNSSYWFYLSDPKTRKTIFSISLDEHAQNRVRYLAK